MNIPNVVGVFISSSLSSPSIAHTRARALSHPNLWRRSFGDALIVGLRFKIDKESCLFYFWIPHFSTVCCVFWVIKFHLNSCLLEWEKAMELREEQVLFTLINVKLSSGHLEVCLKHGFRFKLGASAVIWYATRMTSLCLPVHLIVRGSSLVLRSAAVGAVSVGMLLWEASQTNLGLSSWNSRW